MLLLRLSATTKQ